MIITSKIKTMFNNDLLRYTAAVCDTKRIESTAEKMILLGDLLYTHGISFEILGGATNRLALQIDGYAVKFAMDEQGYLDNLIEYSLSPELQPYATKAFETNGYILIAELVEVIREESKFRARKYEILKVLETLSSEYLLGDVGYIAKNMTNWGIRDGNVVILDYAYCHRATENLFTCSCCGQPLTYDASYDVLLCTDRVSCKTRYTYNERKRVQGKAVDENMVAERKADSIKMAEGVVSKDIERFQDRLLGDNYFVINNPGDLHRYERLKEELKMNLSLNGRGEDDAMMSKFTAMVRLVKNPNDEEAKKVLYQNLDESEPEIPEPVYTENYQNTYAFGYVPPMKVYNNLNQNYDGDECSCEYDDEGEVPDGRDHMTLDDIIRQAKAAREKDRVATEELQRTQEDAYIADLKRRQEEQRKRDEQKRKQQQNNQSQQKPAVKPNAIVEEPPVVEETPQVEEEEPTEETTPEVVDEQGVDVVTEDASEEIEETGETETVEETTGDEPEEEEPVDDDYFEDEPEETETEVPGILVNGKPIVVGGEVRTDVRR